MRVQVSDEQIQQAFEMVKDDPTFSESVQAMKRGRRPGEMLQALAAAGVEAQSVNANEITAAPPVNRGK